MRTLASEMAATLVAAPLSALALGWLQGTLAPVAEAAPAWATAIVLFLAWRLAAAGAHGLARLALAPRNLQPTAPPRFA